MKTNNLMGIMALTLIVLVGGLLYLGYGMKTTNNVISPNGGSGTVINTGSCPADGTTDLKIDVKNIDNKTGSEGFDVTGYLYKIVDGKEQYVTTISDTTSPSATSIDCGAEYVFKPIGTDGASGDSSNIVKVLSGNAQIKDGNLYFTADTPTDNLVIGMEQHATLECRAWDNNQGAFTYDSSDATNTDYELTGVTWEGTSNTTKIDETLGLDYDLQCVAVQSDTNYNDRGIIVLVKAPTSTWQEPVVYANGVKLAEATTSLNSYELRAYGSTYQYAFIIPENVAIKSGANGIDLRVKMNLLDGVASSSADPQILLVPRTQYLSTLDGITVKQGAVEDDSSTTQIYTGYTMTFDTA